MIQHYMYRACNTDEMQNALHSGVASIKWQCTEAHFDVDTRIKVSRCCILAVPGMTDALHKARIVLIRIVLSLTTTVEPFVQILLVPCACCDAFQRKSSLYL